MTESPPSREPWRGIAVHRALMTASSPFSPVQKADLERVLWVDIVHSPSRRAMAAMCAIETLGDVANRR